MSPISRFRRLRRDMQRVILFDLIIGILCSIGAVGMFWIGLTTFGALFVVLASVMYVVGVYALYKGKLRQ